MSNRNLTHIAPPLLGARLHAPRSLSTSIAALLRASFRTITAWLRRRRERERLLESARRLLEFLASDHRAASDIGYPHRRE